MVSAGQGLQRSQPWQQRSQAPQRWPCQASTTFQPGGALQLPSDRWGAAGTDDCRLTEQPLEQPGSRRANMSLCWLHLRPVSNVTVWHDRLRTHQLHVYSIILIDSTPPSASPVLACVLSGHSTILVNQGPWLDLRCKCECVWLCVLYVSLAVLCLLVQVLAASHLQAAGSGSRTKNKPGAL